MKKLVVFLLLIGVLMSTGCFSDSTSNNVATPATTLTFKPSFSMSSKAGEPVLNDSAQTIVLEFGLPLNLSTITGEVKLYKVKADGTTVEEPSVAFYDEMAPTKINLAKADGSKLTEGEEYKVTVSQKLKSTTGLALEKAYEGYFATNYSFALGAAGIKDMNNERTQIIVVSDIHMGADIRYSQFDANYKGNGAAFVDFINKMSQSPNVAEFVIAGDLLDEWIVPGEVDTFGGSTQAAFVDKTAVTHSAVITALKNLMASGVKLTYVLGNHDMLVETTDFSRILPGINQAVNDIRGAAKYSPAGRPEIAIEHGHRYNIFAAPDAISKPGSILPPGYFFARVGTTSFTEGMPPKSYDIPTVTPNTISPSTSQSLLYKYWQSWVGVLNGLYVRETFTEKFLVTNIDGYTEKYAMSDFYPYQTTPGGVIDVNLYKGIQDNWYTRCTQNNVPVTIPVETAIVNASLASDLDDKARTQYFTNPVTDSSNFYYGKRIVIFGHSHEPRVLTSTNLKSQKSIYANTGTWIDSNPVGPTMDFVVVTPAKSGSAAEFVGCYQYYNSGNIRKIDAQALNINQ